MVALKSSGFTVGVLSSAVIPARDRFRSVQYAKADLWHGLPTYRSYRRRAVPARWEPFERRICRNYTSLRRNLIRYIGEYGRPDVIHAHNLLGAGATAQLASEEFGIPFVVTEHTGDYAESVDRVVQDRAFLLPIADSAKRVMAVGTRLKYNLSLGIYGGIDQKIIHVPNVIDAGLLGQLPDSHSDRTQITGIGSLIASKNYSLLIEAFKRAELFKSYTLEIIGNGPERKSLQGLIDTLKLGKSVFLTGQKDRSGVLQSLDRTAFFVHPSLKESFGVVVIEAMARGLPVVAVKSQGPSEIIDSDVGYLSEPTVEDLSRCMLEIAQRAATWDRHKSRAIAIERFGPERFATQMLNIYRSATSRSE